MYETISFRVRGVRLAAKSKVVRWAVSGELPKILAEVCLIIIASLVREPRPIHRLCRVNRAEDVLQPIETCQCFWRDTNHPVELCEQVTLADTHMISQRLD